MAWKPGTIAIDWERQVVRIRSHEADYWYDIRALNVGAIRLLDASVTREDYEIFEPWGSRWRGGPKE